MNARAGGEEQAETRETARSPAGSAPESPVGEEGDAGAGSPRPADSTGRGNGDAREEARNPGTELDLDEVARASANRSAIEKRAETLGRRRSVKQEWQAAWLLRAVTCLDLTSLAGDDTPGRVRRLCAKARQPVRPDILRKLGVGDRDVRVGSVCVYGALAPVAVEALEGSGIPVAAVAAGFPGGLSPFEARLEEIRRCVEAGAREIDIVISRRKALLGAWRELYDEVRAFREACGDAHLKVILATGELGTLRNVARASQVAMMAGADFIKTSTGMESVNATLPVGLVMARAIRRYHDRTGHRVGFKPAGGIRTAKEALQWLYLVRDELGRPWLDSRWFRFGASSLLADLERQLEHHATGRYSAFHRHPMA